jgi:putative PIN family toxin of toxin-antitoxin system
VLVAAHISRAGVCAELLETVLAEQEWISSPYILRDVARTLRDKFAFPAGVVREIEGFLREAGESVDPAPLPEEVCRDPEDRPVLGTAIAGRASLLVSVDKDLLELREYEGIRIVKPGEFWRVTRGAG